MHYKTIAEPTIAGIRWQHLFHMYWPAYKSWLNSKGFSHALSLHQRESALKKYMPKMWDTYIHLCSLLNTDDNELAKKFLTGYCPPIYISACAQAVIKSDEIQLVRNYDYHPDLFEGTLLLSKWNQKKVIATTDCLIGAVDGINEAGLCVSFTFGGRKEVGIGFGIPFILRYVLEFCNHTEEAVAELKSIPSHMSYNVTIVDKKGHCKTVMLSPDKAPIVSNDTFATNHQGIVDWPENAQFNQTIKRSNFLKNYLQTKNISAAELAKAFLYPPLYNSFYKEGFGTLYTAVYQPENLNLKILWPGIMIERSFDSFPEDYLTIEFVQSNLELPNKKELDKNSRPLHAYNWEDAVVDSLVGTLADEKIAQEKIRKQLMHNGKVAWDQIINYWNEVMPK